MKRLTGVLVALGMLAVLAAPAVMAQDDAFGGIMNMTYPEISDAALSPASPAANVAVKVTATVAMSSDEDGASIKSVKAGYSVNGGAIQYVDMAGAGDVYTGTIPGQPAGAKVGVFILAMSDHANAAVTGLAGRMVPGAGDVDRDVDIVPDDLDLMDVAFGVDGHKVMLQYSVQGQIHGGTLDPPFVHLYAAKITNPDVDMGEGLMVGKLCAFLPLLITEVEKRHEFGGMLGVDLPESGAACLDIGKLIQQDLAGYLQDAVIDSKAVGNTHTLTVDVRELGDNPGGMLRVIFATIANAGIDSFAPIPMNCTGFTQFYYDIQLGFSTPGAAPKPAADKVKMPVPPSDGPGLRRQFNSLNRPGIW